MGSSCRRTTIGAGYINHICVCEHPINAVGGIVDINSASGICGSATACGIERELFTFFHAQFRRAEDGRLCGVGVFGKIVGAIGVGSFVPLPCQCTFKPSFREGCYISVGFKVFEELRCIAHGNRQRNVAANGIVAHRRDGEVAGVDTRYCREGREGDGFGFVCCDRNFTLRHRESFRHGDSSLQRSGSCIFNSESACHIGSNHTKCAKLLLIGITFRHRIIVAVAQTDNGFVFHGFHPRAGSVSAGEVFQQVVAISRGIIRYIECDREDHCSGIARSQSLIKRFGD